MNITLSGKRALVTGGNSGIGLATVRALAGAGAKVAINYVAHPEAADEAVKDIDKNGGEAIAVEADVADPKSVSTMFDTIDTTWGGIDILVANAGIDGKTAPAWEFDLDAWRKVIEVNLFGAFYCCREALARMVPKKSGVIVAMSSVHEVIAWSGHSAYTVSKAGVGMLIKTLAQEAAPYGVRVFAVGPGAIKTDINRDVWSDPKMHKDLLDKIPMNRLGVPEEIATMITVLASDAGSYVTGRTFYVDGGMTDYPNFSHGG